VRGGEQGHPGREVDDVALDPRPQRHPSIRVGSFNLDPGGDVHVVRNEGSVDLVNIVITLVPTGAARRIDEPDPGNCSF
jgi:hypothetical protein